MRKPQQPRENAYAQHGVLRVESSNLSAPTNFSFLEPLAMTTERPKSDLEPWQFSEVGSPGTELEFAL